MLILLCYITGVHQSTRTFIETDHSYCCPRRESGHVGTLVDVTNMPGSWVQHEPLPGPSRSGPLFAVDSTVFPVPSGSTSTTCLTTNEECYDQTPLTKFDAGMFVYFFHNYYYKCEMVCPYYLLHIFMYKSFGTWRYTTLIKTP